MSSIGPPDIGVRRRPYTLQVDWPTARTADTFAPVGGREHHQLDVFLAQGEIQDVRLDGESVWPTWFKVEWKGQGDLSAKVHGVRLATRLGDRILFHEGVPN